MAELLFQSSDHTPEACEKLAARAGLDMARFRMCRSAPETKARLDANRWIESVGVRGLPVIWIGKRRLVGQQSTEALEQALRQAAQTD